MSMSRYFLVLLMSFPVIDGQGENFIYDIVNKDKEVLLKPAINQTVDSMLACSQMCSIRKKCVSFAFNSISRECILYNDYITDSTKTNVKKKETTVRVQYEYKRRRLPIMSVKASSEASGLPAINVIDGDMTSCFMTEALDFEPWLVVDLGDVYTISDVIVHTSDDLYVQQRFHDVNFELYSVDPRLNPGVEGLCCGSTEGLSASRVVVVRCSCNVAGRYLKIYIEKSEKLTICHIQVLTTIDSWGCYYQGQGICKKVARGPDITIGKMGSQSSAAYKYGHKFPLDGNRTTCNKVRVVGEDARWTLHLIKPYNITSITIANIEGPDSEYLQNLDVKYSINYGTANLCKHFDGYFGATIRTFECDTPVIADIIIISKPLLPLRLCTVEVIGYLVDT